MVEALLTESVISMTINKLDLKLKGDCEKNRMGGKC